MATGAGSSGRGTRLDRGAEGTEPLADDSGPLRGGRGEFWQAYCERGAAINVRWRVRTSAPTLKDAVEGQKGRLFNTAFALNASTSYTYY